MKQNGSFLPPEIVIPTDRHGNMILNYTAVRTQAKGYSYSQIFQASKQTSKIEQLKEELTGKIVILSETVEKPFNIRSTSDEDRFPSVAVHTAVIQNILTESKTKSMIILPGLNSMTTSP